MKNSNAAFLALSLLRPRALALASASGISFRCCWSWQLFDHTAVLQCGLLGIRFTAAYASIVREPKDARGKLIRHIVPVSLKEV